MDEFIFRVGTFFLLIGTFLFIIFVASDMTDQTDFDFFFLSLIAIVSGWLMRKKKKPALPSGRFGFYKKMRENARKKAEEKNKKSAEKKK